MAVTDPYLFCRMSFPLASPPLLMVLLQPLAGAQPHAPRFPLLALAQVYV